eukprot:TRINITY_DN2671_c0_g1_i1.p1 TRINITY_DN2671_c0_g1~~TRINITY_DN2671_c0_g1_i1.p1  ORF type:complete len:178 (+),score=12.90 TRINITY_DN2671_c0_g1_i1:278-811(+)
MQPYLMPVSVGLLRRAVKHCILRSSWLTFDSSSQTFLNPFFFRKSSSFNSSIIHSAIESHLNVLCQLQSSLTSIGQNSTIFLGLLSLSFLASFDCTMALPEGEEWRIPDAYRGSPHFVFRRKTQTSRHNRGEDALPPLKPGSTRRCRNISYKKSHTHSSGSDLNGKTISSKSLNPLC